MGLTTHSSGDDIKAAFLHCGGKASTLKDSKRVTFEDAIVEQFAERFKPVESSEDDAKNLEGQSNTGSNGEDTVVPLNMDDVGKVEAI